MLRNTFHIVLLAVLSLLLTVQPGHPCLAWYPEADGDAAEKTACHVETSARAARYLKAVTTAADQRTAVPGGAAPAHLLPAAWYRPTYYTFLHRFSLF